MGLEGAECLLQTLNSEDLHCISHASTDLTLHAQSGRNPAHFTFQMYILDSAAGEQLSSLSISRSLSELFLDGTRKQEGPLVNGRADCLQADDHTEVSPTDTSPARGTFVRFRPRPRSRRASSALRYI